MYRVHENGFTSLDAKDQGYHDVSRWQWFQHASLMKRKILPRKLCAIQSNAQRQHFAQNTNSPISMGLRSPTPIDFMSANLSRHVITFSADATFSRPWRT